MAQGQQKVKRTQPPHKKSQPSRHDRRGHLAKPNPERRKTARAQIPLVGTWAEAVGELAQALDRRMAFRLAIIVAGRLLADDRRTASAWFAAAGVLDDGDCFYDTPRQCRQRSTRLRTVIHLSPNPPRLDK